MKLTVNQVDDILRDILRRSLRFEIGGTSSSRLISVSVMKIEDN